MSSALVKNVVIYGLGDAIIRALGVVTVPIFTRILSPTDYGVLSVLVALTAVVGLINDAGMVSAAQRQYFDEKGDSGKRQATATAVWFSLSLGIILTALGILLAKPLAGWLLGNSELDELIILAFLSSGLGVIVQLVRSFFRLTFTPWPFMVSTVLTGILSLGVAAWLVFQGQGVMGYFGGLLIGTAFGFFITLILGRRFLAFTYDRERLTKMLRYGLPLVPAAAALFVVDLSDRFLLARLRDLSEVGIYSVGVSVASMMTLFIGAFAQAWAPFALSKHAEMPKESPFLFARFLLYVLVFFSALALLITLFSQEILQLLTTAAFFDAVKVVPILALGYVVFATTQLTTLGMSIARRTSVIAIGALLAALVNIGGNLLLVPNFGMLGAAWATLAAYLVLTITYGAVSSRYLRCPWPWGRIGRLAPVVALGFGLTFVLPDGVGLVTAAWKIAYFGAFAGLVLLSGAVDREELKILRQIIAVDLKFWKRTRSVPRGAVD
ncbi:MAG: flippase [Candidatus Berkelbacteria bacterium]|nr:MAG: flippase [Candidatus Berkelbacteria bacterium]QQG51676.1 MAG: flippase [Candidatus Berkelbacteria bacterium]